MKGKLSCGIRGNARGHRAMEHSDLVKKQRMALSKRGHVSIVSAVTVRVLAGQSRTARRVRVMVGALLSANVVN